MSMRPSAAASDSPESNALSVHHTSPRACAASRSRGSVRKSPAPRSIGRRGAGRRGAPRRFEELAVGVAEGDRARDRALRVDQRDRGALGEVVDERHESIGERGQERLHALDGDALSHLLEHAAESGELVLELPARARAPARSGAARGWRRATPRGSRPEATAGPRLRTRGSGRPRRRRTRRGRGEGRSAGRHRGCRRGARTRRAGRPCRRGGRRVRRAAPRRRRDRGPARPRRARSGATSVSPAASGWMAPRTDAVMTSGVAPCHLATWPSTSRRVPTISALGLRRS